MKSYVLMILLLLGCLSAHAQNGVETLMSLHKENWKGVEEIPQWASFGYSDTGATLEVVDEGLAITNPHVQAEVWQPTVTVVDNCLTLEEGHDYIVRMTVKVPSDGTYQMRLGNWDHYDMRQVHVKASNDFQIVDVEYPEYKGNAAGDGHVLLQLGWVEGTTVIKEIEVLEKTGYWHNSDFHELIRDESSLYNFVQPWNEESQKTLNELLAGKRITDDQSIIRFDEDRYYVRKDYSLPQGDYYVSDLYKLNIPNREEKTVYIMPRISMFLKDGFMIDDILEHLDNRVTIPFVPEDNRYNLDCHVNTSEEVLEIFKVLNALYKCGNYGISWYYPWCLYVRPNTLPDAYTYKYTEDGMKLVYEKNWEGEGYHVSDEEEDLWEGTDEGLAITNPRMQENIWDLWTFIAWDFSLEQGHDYLVRLTMKVPSNGTYQMNLNGGAFLYNSLCQVPVTAGDDFQVIDFEYPDFGDDFWSDGHIFFQSGWVVGTTVLKKVEILEKANGGTAAVKAVKTSKADDTIYNLAGQRVNTSYKGIVIQNGRKYVK